MANTKILMANDFLEGLSSLEEGFKGAAEEALQAAGQVVFQEMHQQLSRVITGDHSTGELLQSLGVSPVKLDHNGDYNLKVGFREPRRDGKKSNAMLASILEHGKHGQPARPFLKRTKAAVHPPQKAALSGDPGGPAIAAMERVMLRYFGKK